MLKTKCMIPMSVLCLACVLLLCISCTHNSMTEPDQETQKYEVAGLVVVVDSSGEEIMSRPLRSVSEIENEKATMTGLGYFAANVSTKVVVTPKPGYAVKGLYFRHDGGYNTTSYPTSRSRMLNKSALDIRVVANITVVAVVSDSGIGVVIE